MKVENITIVVIVALSVVLNICLIAVLLQKTLRYTFMHYFLFNMALCSLFQGLLAYPLELSSLLKGRKKMDFECLMGAILVFGLALVVIWTIALLSIDRVLAMKFPYLYKRCIRNKKRFVFLSITFTWLIGGFWALTPLLGWSSYQKEMKPSHRCNINFRSKDPVNMSYLCSLMVTCYVVPVTIMISSLTLVKKSLRKMSIYAEKRVGRRASLSLDAQRCEKRQTLLTLLMIFSFFYAWTPYTIVVTFLMLDKSVPPTVYTIAALNAKTSSFYCPLLYGFVYKPLRSTFKSAVSKIMV
uniref:Opsin n=1 Tax=Cladonema radiatum TaxID=264074 RepID=A9CR28_9CNID|nr:opsin [Cladonema radiatum]